jgi:PST family polysaccharide transporter
VNETNLSQKALTGTAWSMLSTIARQGLSIASVATVARLLGPGAYGIMGMANLLLAFILNFRDLGTGTAIVQRISVSQPLLASLFWLNVALGTALALITAAASPFMARFFHTPELTAILSTIACSFIFTSAGIVQNSLLLREMKFKALAIIDVGSSILAYVTALTCAYKGLGVWSLVWANLANSVGGTTMYWIASSWRPSFQFNRAEINSVMNFSLNLSGFGFVNYANRNADNVVVGRMLGQADLGNYQMAYNLMITPLQSISSVIGQVTLPAFSKIQNDDERFRAAFLRSSSIVALVSFPVMAGLGVVADPLIRAVLGAKWIAAIPIFQILAPVGLVQSVQTLVGLIYVAKGRTDWLFRMGAYCLLILIPAFLIGVHFGVTGVAKAYFLSYFVFVLYPCFAVPFHLIGLKFRHFARVLLPQLLVTAAMVLACFGWLQFASIGNNWLRLISAIVIGAAVYLLGLRIAKPPTIRYLRDIMDESANPVLRKGAPIVRFLAG